VLDAWQSMIDEQWQEGIVAVCSHNTLVRKQWPLINRLDPSQMNQEILLNEGIIKNPVLGNLPAVTVPFFPDNAVLITPLANLCLYWQRGSVRGLVKNEPQYNRLAFYESCNLDWVVGQYEAGCLLDGIDWKE
ncbi:phage major capsid protein, P2 family, partial [Escherichia coli]|nr:phage major capsid protein, P2 family [Escherichia coli]MCK3614847.1 phage major capsid protein, P2 family [Escherichia coli]